MEPPVAVTTPRRSRRLAEEIAFVFKAARPGFWLTSIWFYQAEFWLGLLYVTFPLGVLIYGWNDVVDFEADRFNPRKGTYLFGARGTPERSHVSQVPWFTFLFGAMFAMHSHLFGEIMDLEPDRRAGRRTLAGVLHARPAKWLLIAFLAVEAVLIWTCARDPWLAAFLVGSAGWFVLDVMLVWRDRPYSPGEMRLLFLAWNAVALASMPWMWHAASLAPR